MGNLNAQPILTHMDSPWLTLTDQCTLPAPPPDGWAYAYQGLKEACFIQDNIYAVRACLDSALHLPVHLNFGIQKVDGLECNWLASFLIHQIQQQQEC
eukprot:UN00732